MFDFVAGAWAAVPEDTAAWFFRGCAIRMHCMARGKATCMEDLQMLEPGHQENRADFKLNSENFSLRLTRRIFFIFLRLMTNTRWQNVR